MLMMEGKAFMPAELMAMTQGDADASLATPRRSLFDATLRPRIKVPRWFKRDSRIYSICN